MPSNKKKFIRTLFTSNGSCGCGNSKLSEVIEPISRLRSKFSTRSSSSSFGDRSIGSDLSQLDDYHRNNISLNNDSSSSSSSRLQSEHETAAPKNSTVPSPLMSRPKLVESYAVEKYSDDPYEDFRDSMMQMIVENEIYRKDGLQELLNCFLELNSPCNHDIIVQAFTYIWTELASKRLIL